MPFKTLTLCLIMLLLFGCSNESKYAGAAERDMEYAEEAPETEEQANLQTTSLPGDPTSTSANQNPEAKIIYTASARGRVTQLDSALAALHRRINAAGGYLSNQHRTNSNWEHTATLTVRLPAENLASTLSFLTEITEEMDYQNLDSREVTAEWLDLENRLKTKREVRDRYIEILRNKARKVEDILNAEDKIRIITEEIEAKEGRLRYLRDQVSLSTLTLELYETREYQPVGPVTRRTFGSKLVASLINGWVMVQELLIGLVAIWPLLILGSIGVWAFRRWKKKQPK